MIDLIALIWLLSGLGCVFVHWEILVYRSYHVDGIPKALLILARLIVWIIMGPVSLWVNACNEEVLYENDKDT